MGTRGVYADYTAKQFEENWDIVKVLLRLERRLSNAKNSEERRDIENLMYVISLGSEEGKCRI
jgi:hypothetical protein